MRHLGSTLYAERVKQYKAMRGLADDDYSFSEADLVRFFKGERREMERYIIDAQRDAITHNPENRLLEFVEWSGKTADRPVAYQQSKEYSFQHSYIRGPSIRLSMKAWKAVPTLEYLNETRW
jgi:hypothetical protein